jgi:hypothetical protein
MRKRVGAVLAVAAVGVGLTVPAFGGSALAASGSERDCEAAGGTYTKSGPDSICLFPEEQVANDNASDNNNSQTTQDETTGHGNLGNKPVEECTGPPGQCAK